jgi:hypothetical protein
MAVPVVAEFVGGEKRGIIHGTREQLDQLTHSVIAADHDQLPVDIQHLHRFGQESTVGDRRVLTLDRGAAALGDVAPVVRALADDSFPPAAGRPDVVGPRLFRRGHPLGCGFLRGDGRSRHHAERDRGGSGQYQVCCQPEHRISR